MDKNSKIYVAGHRGLAGSAILRALENGGYTNIITKTHSELDLTIAEDVKEFFKQEKPEYVFIAAAKVGGIGDNNTHPVEFITENLKIQINIIENAYKNGVKKLLFLGSSCIYPKMAEQPIKEEYFMTGKLEPTSQAYAIAKIAGIMMCQSYTKQYGMQTLNVMPANLYGPNDNFDLEKSHVLPALIRKFYEAKENNLPEVVTWGTGSPKREFLHSDDLASACVFLMKNHSDSEIVNIGTGEEISIFDLVNMVKNAVGYTGKVVWDSSKPEGTPRKVMDVSKLHSLGWKHQVNLKEGIENTFKWYNENKNNLR
jgi:GDP-L-fucose synthase